MTDAFGRSCTAKMCNLSNRSTKSGFCYMQSASNGGLSITIIIIIIIIITTTSKLHYDDDDDDDALCFL